MFGKQQDPSRTEEATPKRVKKQRAEGNVPKSAELGKAVSLTGGLIILTIWIGPLKRALTEVFHTFLDCSRVFEVNAENIYALAVEISFKIAYMILPIMLFLAFLALVSQRIQVGKLWTTNIFKPKLQRFNLVKGLKRLLISPQTLLRVIKSLLFCIGLSIIPAVVIYKEHEDFLYAYYETPEGIAAYMLELGFELAKYSLVPILLIAAFDVWQSRYAYRESMKMTKEEVKDERKQAEGDPKIKNQQRKKMMAIAMKRMMKQVPKADVVVTNPTHLAVALSYNAQEAPAPIVVAKGAGYVAERIKTIAKEHKVPIRENVPLARALFKACEVGDMIPEELYKAVAAILASIWRLKPRTHKVQPQNTMR
ncbi:MAG: flagellar biosynthesis protein FlhB [Desulfovibrionaceae bacterium]|nr:flagellar biosynthesis protein FlhB [Desulfovibrionaceae bacterium]